MNLETAKREVEKIYNQETAKLKKDNCYFLHFSITKLLNEKHQQLISLGKGFL